MSDVDTIDLEAMTIAAWRRFRATLADAVAGLEQDRPLLEVRVGRDEEAASSLCVQFRVDGADREAVHAELPRNRHLPEACRLDRRAQRRLVELGWSRPASDRSHWRLSDDRAHADRLAVRAVETLRVVLGVVHPSFLGGDVVLEPDPQLFAVIGPAVAARENTAAGGECPDGGVEGLQAVPPRDFAHLLQLVDEALTPVFGETPVKDGDGDIPVVVGDSVVFVRVLPEAPVVRLFCLLVTDVSKPRRAAFEVGVLNRDHAAVKFDFADGRVRAVLQLPAMPFAAEHLRQGLEVMCSVAEDVVPDLCVRVGGQPFLGASH